MCYESNLTKFSGTFITVWGSRSTHDIDVINPRKAMVLSWRSLTTLRYYTFLYTGMTMGDSIQVGSLET